VLITPSHQFPLGVTMSLARRIQLLEWARESGAWVIEDDYDSEFRFDGPPIPSLQGIDRGERVVYIGTFSKVLFPSIRMGYVVVPPDLMNRFETVRRIMDISPPRFSQDLLAAFMEQGHFARHIRKMRVIYRERREMLANTLERNLGSQLEVIGSEAGLHLTAFLRTRADDLSIAMQAAGHQLWLWPLSMHYLGPPQKAGFVLGFGSSTPDDISMAAGKLERLLSTRQPSEMNNIQLKRVAMR
jgi:GntR family transcriptional regulator/MocR family aminotransferase